MLCFSGSLSDLRLERRAAALFAVLRAHRCVSIRRIAADRAEQIAFYRLLRGDALTQEALTDALLSRTAALAQESSAGHFLCIQDTTQFNFERHAGRLGDDSGLGVIGDNESLGFFLHPTLVVEAETGYALGFSHLKLWTRPAQRPDKHARQFRRLPIEAKESFRWIESMVGSRAVLPAGATITSVADREGDIYDLFYRCLPGTASLGTDVEVRADPETKTGGEAPAEAPAETPAEAPAETHVLVRSRTDRRTREGSLKGLLDAAPVAGKATTLLRGDRRRGRSARQARLMYRYRRVYLSRPSTCNAPEAPAEVALWAVDVREDASGLPDGEQPVHWRLLTTHPVESFAQAKRVVGWYRQRWQVEQVFRVMKTEGFALEASELEHGASLFRLTMLVLGAALDVMRLMLAERGAAEGEPQASHPPLGHVFSALEAALLISVGARVEGRTAKQQNPHRGETLAWGGWVIARLGGWKGYRSQRRPGPIVYHRGLTRFRAMFDGWILAHGDVCTP